MAYTSHFTTLTPRIASAIAFPHCLSAALIRCGPISVICPSGSTAALAVCLTENDLIAVGVRHGGIPASPSDHYALEVDLLCFSSGGGEHPSAREPTFCVRDFCRTDGATMEMEIRADLVVLLQEHRAKPEFLIFDWKTARNIARLTDQVDAFWFLSDKVIVVANRCQESLDLLPFPNRKEIWGEHQ